MMVQKNMGFIFDMFDQRICYGWYQILDKGSTKIMLDFNHNGIQNTEDMIEETPYVAYYEIDHGYLTFNNRTSDSGFHIGKNIDEIKTRKDYTKAKISLINPRSAGIGDLSVMGLKENTYNQEGFCFAAIGPFVTQIRESKTLYLDKRVLDELSD